MIINEYETTYITRPDLPEDMQTAVFEKLLGVIKKYNGELFVHDDWGRRKLAYPIKKHNHGHYVYLNYTGPADLPQELERIIRLDDQILRFLTVRLGSNISLEDVREPSITRHKSWVERRQVQETPRERR